MRQLWSRGVIHLEPNQLEKGSDQGGLSIRLERNSEQATPTVSEAELSSSEEDLNTLVL